VLLLPRSKLKKMAPKLNLPILKLVFLDFGLTRDRCYDFRRKIWRKILAVFCSKPLLVFEKNRIMTLAFEKSANFFRIKWAKIADHHNIDPSCDVVTDVLQTIAFLLDPASRTYGIVSVVLLYAPAPLYLLKVRPQDDFAFKRCSWWILNLVLHPVLLPWAFLQHIRNVYCNRQR
jgi:hypothetical protein